MNEPGERKCKHEWVQVLDKNGVILFSVCNLCHARLGPPPWYIQAEDEPHPVEAEDILFKRTIELSHALICMAFGVSPDML